MRKNYATHLGVAKKGPNPIGFGPFEWVKIEVVRRPVGKCP